MLALLPTTSLFPSKINTIRVLKLQARIIYNSREEHGTVTGGRDFRKVEYKVVEQLHEIRDDCDLVSIRPRHSTHQYNTDVQHSVQLVVKRNTNIELE